jgi:L-alanine-DL-glutamate epimerase-like enolase superfamily enzyme
MPSARPAAMAAIAELRVGVYQIPTDRAESDGTLSWQSTTLVTAEADAAGRTGLGWTYDHPAAATLVKETLANVVCGRDALDLPGAWLAMLEAVRNLGRPGIAACAISAVDVALWDLKAKLLEVPLALLLGRMRERVPLYGSGGFSSYSERELQAQLAGWVEQGFSRVKMKVGREPSHDTGRVIAARQAIGEQVELFVDANGAYTAKQALEMAERFKSAGVSWFEEPVPSDDLAGLRLIRSRAPAGMAITAGEYGYDPWYFQRMLEAEAVDILQADATRCLGLSGLLEVGALCAARCLPLSAHTAPYLHLAAACALRSLVHVEYFHDHARIEQRLFDGARAPIEGALAPDLSRPGHGLELKRRDAERFAR